nr:MAG TPA: Putative Holin-like Toxin (Hol-Tox) [Caudoviricetes sp.]
MLMVTYSDLIQIGILIVGILGLILQITKRK